MFSAYGTLEQRLKAPRYAFGRPVKFQCPPADVPGFVILPCRQATAEARLVRKCQGAPLAFWARVRFQARASEQRLHL